MRGWLIGGLFAALAATGAQAQVSRCGWEFGKWVCRADQARPDASTIFQQGQDAYQRSYDQMERQRRDREDAQAYRTEASRQALDAAKAEHRQALENTVAQAVREGRCADAKDMALSVSDFTLADQAQRLCTPR